MSPLVLRIFSGIHFGAEIGLKPGTWVFGADDSCDIILGDADLQGRHAALVISENGATFKVEVRPLDGVVQPFDGTGPEATELTALTPYRMGGVIFAWMKRPADPAGWQAVVELLQARRGEGESEAGAAPEPAPRTEESEQATPAPSEPEPESSPTEPSEQEERPRGTAMRIWLALVALLALVAFLVLLLLRSSDPASHESTEAISKRLEQGGFSGLSVSETAPGRFLVSGSVADDAERGRLLRLAETLPVSAQFKVSVDSDVLTALQSQFNAGGFWPEVSFGKDKDGKRTLRIRGYMQNAATESAAFDNAASAVPELKNGTYGVERTIVHDSQVRGALSDALAAHGVNDAQVQCLPGSVKLLVPSALARRATLQNATNDAGRKLGVPVKVDVAEAVRLVQPPAPTVAVAAPAPVAAPARPVAPRASAAPSFKVSSASFGALKFITLSDGQKVFEGGRLPGGYTLEEIRSGSLVLSRKGKRINYPLKVQ